MAKIIKTKLTKSCISRDNAKGHKARQADELAGQTGRQDRQADRTDKADRQLEDLANGCIKQPIIPARMGQCSRGEARASTKLSKA